MVGLVAGTEQGSTPFARISWADDDDADTLAARAFNFAAVGIVSRLRTEIQTCL